MKLLVTALAIVGLVAMAAPVANSAQLTVYFDAAHTVRSMDCPGPGLQSLYIVLEDANEFVTGVEYKLNLPPQLIWLGDAGTPPVTIGTSVTGISMGFPIPLNGFNPIQVTEVIALWNCTDCAFHNNRITLEGHPLNNPGGPPQYTRWPDLSLHNAPGSGALVCELVNMDIKPGSCPNAFNKKFFEFGEDDTKALKGGITPIALAGSPDFPVDWVDMSSLNVGGLYPKIGPKLQDAATALGDIADCDCSDDMGDGIMDIWMGFVSKDLAQLLAGQEGYQKVVLSGTLLDGTPFEATDCVKIVGKTEQPGLQNPDGPTLGPAYPNPFNPVTRISFFLPEAQNVRVAIYDVAGRLIDVLADGVADPGEHVLEWDARGKASGVYFYTLKTQDETLVRRMTLLK